MNCNKSENGPLEDKKLFVPVRLKDEIVNTALILLICSDYFHIKKYLP